MREPWSRHTSAQARGDEGEQDTGNSGGVHEQLAREREQARGGMWSGGECATLCGGGKNSSTEKVAGDGMVGVANRLLCGLGGNAGSSLLAAARTPAEGRNGLRLASPECDLGSNGIGENSPMDAAGGSAAGERIPDRDDGHRSEAVEVEVEHHGVVVGMWWL